MRLYSLLYIFLAIPLAFAPLPGLATSPKKCSDSFSRIMLGTDNIYVNMALTPGERSAIVSAFENGRDEAEGFRAALTKYIDFRVSKLPEDRRAEAAELGRYVTSAVAFNREKRFVANAQEIDVPREFRNTAFLASVIAHEMEHTIHLLLKAGSLDKPDIKSLLRLLVNALVNPRYYWRSETGAMRAEWEMLNSMPREAILRSIQVTEKSEVSNDWKKQILRALKNSELPWEQYLRAEHEAGRYSFGNIAIIQGRRLLILIAALGIGTETLLWTGGAAKKKLCDGLSRDHPLFERFCV